MMHLNLYTPLADGYNSNSQKIRILTEDWVEKYIFCPSCGIAVKGYENNNIQAKIRQQLQILRDKNYLEFIERGKYKIRG